MRCVGFRAMGLITGTLWLVMLSAGFCAEPVVPQGVVLTPVATQHPMERALVQTLTQDFREHMQAVIACARRDVLARRHVRNPAVVLDLDETLMDMRAYYLTYKQFDPTLFNTWLLRADAPAIPETLAFVRWLNARHIPVYFVTGRREAFRAATVKNLARYGGIRYAGLFMKPDGYGQPSAAPYKIDARRQIEARGHRIILSLGDQASDVTGGHADVGLKLPNPLYTIP